MTCIECENIDLQSSPQYSRLEFARCTKLPQLAGGAFQSMTYQRECEKFELADAEIVAKRQLWLAKHLVSNTRTKP